METNQQRLLHLLQEHKITEEEFYILIKALKNKNSCFILTASFLLNPFIIITSSWCITIGILSMIGLSYIGWYLKLHFPGLIGCELAPKNQPFKLIQIGLELFSAWITYSLLFLIIAIILKIRIYRIFDFFAFSSLAKFPYLVLSIICLIIYKIDPAILYLTAANAPNFTYRVLNLVLTILFYIFFIWQIILYFNAYKEASGLIGSKLWFGFIISTIVTNVLLFAFINPFFLSI